MYHSRHHCNLVIEVLSLVPPDPVGQVERPVQAQEEQVVGGNGLGFPSLADHEELGQDGHRFQVDRESPEDLQGSETIVLQEGEANDWDQEKLQAERVILTVKRFPEFSIDHVHCDIGAEEENQLHDCVVDGDEVGEQVQVPGSEDEREKDLALPRDAWFKLRFLPAPELCLT